MITFKAQLLQPTIIKRKGIDNNYHNCAANIVELDTNSRNDFISINKVNCLWTNCTTFVHNISRRFNNIYSHNRKQHEDERFFAITTQKDSFENLDETKILGFMQTRKNKKQEFELEHLQVSPDTFYTSKKRKYTNIGTALLNFLKAAYENRDIYLDAEESAIPFYEKNGLKLLNKKGRMVFKR